MRTNLLCKVTNAKSSKMSDKINHPQLCQWLNAVATSRDKTAFTQLFKFFAPNIQRIARSKFPTEAQVSDVVQETMSKVWLKAHLFDKDKGAATTWVYTVMRNVTFDMLRKIKGNKEDCLSDDIWPIAESQLSEDESFYDHLENEHLLTGIGKLPEVQQQVVKGFYFMEMSQDQLAIHLNLPLGTVKSRLRLALAKLKMQLRGSND